MFQFFKDLSSVFGQEELKKFYILQIYVVLLAFSEFSFIFIIGNLLSWMEGDSSNLLSIALTPLTSFFENKDYAFIGLSISLLIFSGIVSFISAWVIAKFPQKIGALISSRLFFYYMHKNWNFHEKNSTSSLISKLSQEVIRVSNQIIHPVAQINARVVLAIVFIGYLLASYPEVTIVGGTSLLVLYMIVYVIVNQILKERGKEVSETHKKSITYMTYGFQGFIDFLTTNNRFFLTNLFKKNVNKFGKVAGDIKALSTVPRFLIESGVVLIALFSYLIYEFIIGKEINILLSDIAVLGVLGLKLLPIFHQLYSMVAAIEGNYSALDNLKADLMASKDISNIQGSREYSKKNGHEIDIKIENVGLVFEGKKVALDDINISIKNGQKIGFVGESGSGKSSLLKLIVGIYECSTGKISLDRKDIKHYDPEEIFSNITYVPQSIYLINGSILQNIVLGEESNKINYERLNASIDISGLRDFINEKDEGLEFDVGENGSAMSGGQRQRIGIARALYRQSRIYLFDETTSSLDNVIEGKIIKSLTNDLDTILMVTHSIHHLKDFDIIYLFKDGKIIESGTYSFMIEHSKEFVDLID